MSVCDVLHYWCEHCLVLQLDEYKNLAQSLERRIADLHSDCEKKDQEIARLKQQLKSKWLLAAVLFALCKLCMRSLHVIATM